MLKVLAAFIGLIILSLIFFRVLGFEVGVLLGQNDFTGLIANISVISWLLGIFVLIELCVVFVLLKPKN